MGSGRAPTGYESTATERQRSSLGEIAPRAKSIVAGLEQQKQVGFTQEANAEWQRFIASPQGKATLLSNRDKLQNELESRRAQARGGLTNQELAAQSRNQTYQRYIAAFVKSKNEETERGNSTRGANQAQTNGNGGAQGAAAKPVVVAKTQVAKGINNNTKEENLNYIETKNSEFSTGERTKGIFNIGRFRAEVSGADSILPTHSFLTVFAPMPWAIKKFPAGNLDSLLTMRCDNVVLPSINLLQEQNIRRYGFGPVENVAYGVNVGDFTLQFIVDKDALVVEFFEEWLNLIVNRDSFGGANMNNNKIGGLRRPYEIAYKDTYACPNVNVFVYDRSQNAVMEYHIYDVFPTGIQSMNMSWSEENTLMKLNITFSFTDLRIERSKSKNKKSQSINDEIKVTATGPYAVQGIGAGGIGDLATLDPTGARGLELTDLSNETTIIGDGFRTRGSSPPLPPDTFSNRGVELAGFPKRYDTLGNVINQS
jgi:hypothetical protein